MTRLLVRLLAVLLLVAAAALRGAPPAAVAAPPDDDSACRCEVGVGACQHFLRNPAGPTADPCWCDRCDTGRQGMRHDGTTVPSGWNPDCFRSNRLACYLKRHAAAWGIACSECQRLDTCCPTSNAANCPDCDEASAGRPVEKDAWGRDARATVSARLAKERKLFKKPDDVILAYDRHFYVVTDIDGLKVQMPNGIPRPITKHEWIHLTIERAEWCRREWVRKLGDPAMKPPKKSGEPQVDMPMAMWLVARERDKAAVASVNFASPSATYIVGNASRPADGMCMTGMGFSKERCGGDHDLQIEMRHQLAHNLYSCWGHWETRPRSFPQWAYEGLGHWMTRLTPLFRDDAAACVPEGATTGVTGVSGKDWDKDVVKMAASAGLDPIEKLLGKTVKGELTKDEHKRCWSLVSLGLEEIGKPFVELLADMRKERDVREAFVARLGMTPEELDTRWRERVTGKRKSLGADDGAPSGGSAGGGTGGAGTADGGARERESIRGEQDVVTLAAKIRQQGAVADPQMVEVVVDALARKSDLVRETALVTLLKTQDAAARKRLVEYGLAHGDGVARAYAARVCGRLGLADAVPRLVRLLDDSNWYARAEAAVALGRLHHAPAMPALRKMLVSDTAEKAQVAAMDALACFGKDAEMSVSIVAKQLASSRWQLRVAACQTLGAILSMEAVEPLIARMEIESGRVRDEIRAALKEIVRDDLGAKPGNWRTWWDAEKAKHPDALPPRPDAPAVTGKPAATPMKDDYAPARYYGIEIVSDRVAFVVDTSKSMALLFDPDPKAAKVLSREYTGKDKLTICREEVAQALKGIDQRSHFSVVTFGTTVRAFKPNPVPASPGNVSAALDFLASIPAFGETNYYDAFKATLDLGAEPDTSPDFRSTPDTISFLTDGEPSAGEITDGDTLAEWYAGLNRYARIKTHTVTFGLNRVDQPLLKRLAAENWGRFTLVPERTK